MKKLLLLLLLLPNLVMSKSYLCITENSNALMKYLTKALSQLAGYIDHNKSAAKEDANLKFKWEKAMVSYNQLQKALKELRGKHDYGGLWNRIRGKGGMFK